jgi:hypothetical protein
VTEYAGHELELFQHAVNWKRYWGSRISPYLGSTVLEVGAGLGVNAAALISSLQRQWHCLEPDHRLEARIRDRIQYGSLPPICSTQVGTIDDIPADEHYETILYIDVMEHIAADGAEFAKAAAHLATGGHLVILSPAFQALYSPFDAAIGHHRRYTRSTLAQLGAEAPLTQVTIYYLDSVGFLASGANRFFLRKSTPTLRQVHFWDRAMIPVSRFLDPLLFHSLGKTVVGVWRKT